MTHMGGIESPAASLDEQLARVVDAARAAAGVDRLHLWALAPERERLRALPLVPAHTQPGSRGDFLAEVNRSLIMRNGRNAGSTTSGFARTTIACAEQIPSTSATAGLRW